MLLDGEHTIKYYYDINHQVGIIAYMLVSMLYAIGCKHVIRQYYIGGLIAYIA